MIQFLYLLLKVLRVKSTSNTLKDLEQSLLFFIHLELSSYPNNNNNNFFFLEENSLSPQKKKKKKKFSVKRRSPFPGEKEKNLLASIVPKSQRHRLDS